VQKDSQYSSEEAEKLHLELTAQELQRMREEVAQTRVFSATQREQVLTNLHSMARNVERLQSNSSSTTVANLKEALRIRLSILNDNVLGFVSAEDIDRRDRYASIETLLGDVANATEAMPSIVAEHMEKTVGEMRANLKKLSAGLTGQARADVEAKLNQELVSLRADLRGEEELPPNYCGSCYGASPDPAQCCNSCDDIRAAYRQRRWGFPDENNFEQCRRDTRLRHNRVEDGEGCNLFGTMEVARVTGSFNIAPTSTVRRAASAVRMLQQGGYPHAEMQHFNVTHHIKRLSFGTDFPGLQNPLDDMWTYSPGGAAVSRYFLKVVPTTYEFLDGHTVHTNQFSTTQYFKPLDLAATKAMMPRVSFTFELTPLKVEKKEQRAGTFLRFVTRSAAVVGGLFTVAGILDSAWYHSSKHLIKARLNKAS